MHYTDKENLIYDCISGVGHFLFQILFGSFTHIHTHQHTHTYIDR